MQKVKTPMRSGKYTPVQRTRLVDTRDSNSPTGGKFLWARQDLNIRAVGQGDVPWGGVSAVSLLVTVIAGTDSGQLVVRPSGAKVPDVSMISFSAGETVTAGVVASVGFGSPLQIQSPNASKVHVVVDILGWWSDQRSVGAGYVPCCQPFQLLNTRQDMTGRPSVVLKPGDTLTAKCLGVQEIPKDSNAVLVNATLSQGTDDVVLRLGGDDEPLTARDAWCRASAGQTRSVLSAVPIGKNGQIATAVSGGSAHVRLDVLGAFSRSEGLAFSAAQPVRIYDSRRGRGHAYTASDDASTSARLEPVEGAEVVDFPMREVVGIGQNARAVLGFVSIHDGTADTFMTAYRSGRWRPLTPSLHAAAGEDVTNQVVVPLDEFGWAAIHNNAGSQHLTVDVAGYFS